MHVDLSSFVVIILLLASILACFSVLKILHLPTLPAYFLVGYIAGPYGIGILNSNTEANFVAEFGVIFLLFTIGLNLSIRTLKSMRSYVFLLGSIQVLLSIALFGGIAWYAFGDSRLALVIGAIAAMSSTAIVSQLLIQGHAVNSPAGRRTIAILLFQDLAVIPLIVIIHELHLPLIDFYSIMEVLALVLMKIAISLFLVFFIGRMLISKLLDWWASHGDKELFMVSLLFIIIAASWVSAYFDLSYAFGAFMSGVLISDTWHRHRVERIIDPFRSIFLGFFFISIGLLINPTVLLDKWQLVLSAAIVLFLLKTPLVALCVRYISSSYPETAWRSALMLGGTGELGFLFLAIAHDNGIVNEASFQWMLAVNLIVLLSVPLLWPLQEKIIKFLSPKNYSNQEGQHSINDASDTFTEHFVICGFGRTGQAIANILTTLKVPYVAVEDNYQVLRAVSGTENVVYGDSEHLDSMVKTNITQARALIITYLDTDRVIQTIKAVKSRNEDIYILAKSDSVAQSEIFSKAGADDVLVEAHESGFSLALIAMRQMYAKNLEGFDNAVRRARSRENRFFSGDFGHEETHIIDSTHFIGSHVRNSDCYGLMLSDVVSDDIFVIAWRRAEKVLNAYQEDLVLEENDELILKGKLDDIEDLKAYLENRHEPE